MAKRRPQGGPVAVTHPAAAGPDVTAIRVAGVTHRFDGDFSAADRDTAERYALKGVELAIPRGQFLAIVGPSGCGKTTLMNMMAGLIQPTSGTVTRDGEPVRGLARNVGYMFARPGLLPWRDAGSNVRLGLEFRGVGRSQAHRRSSELLAEVGLSQHERSLPAELSQGMRQRVALARVLALDPDYLLMDEPFGALDAQTKMIMQGLFLSIWEKSAKTVVFVTHDLHEAAALADRVIVMTAAPGQIKADIQIPFPRPRQLEQLRFEDRFVELTHHIWTLLRDEVAERE